MGPPGDAAHLVVNRLRVVPAAPGRPTIRIDADPQARARKDAVVGALFFALCCVLRVVGLPLTATPFLLAVLVPTAQVVFRLYLDLVLEIDPSARRVTRRFFGRTEVLAACLGADATVNVQHYGFHAVTPRREHVSGWGVELVDGGAVLVVNAQSEADARLVADTLRTTLTLA